MSRKSFVQLTSSIQITFLILILITLVEMLRAPQGAGWGGMFLMLPLVFVNSIFHLIFSIGGLFAKNYIFILPRLILMLTISIVLLYLKFFVNPKIDYFNYFLIWYIPVCLLFWLLDFLELSDLNKIDKLK